MAESFWQNELTEEERDRLLARAAEEITKRRLHVPAILFLEMHKPLAYIGAHAAVAFSPFVAPFLGFDKWDKFSQLIRSPENIERLIRMIEEDADEGDASPEEKDAVR